MKTGLGLTSSAASSRRRHRSIVPLTASVVVSLASCSSDDPVAEAPPAAAQALTCDETLKTAFKPDADTQVLFVKSFKQGDAISLAATPPANTPTAAADVCLVKLLVGPGNPGPAGAPSTTAGIALEVWLPALSGWDGRIRAEVPGAFMGNPNITST